jgi:hypothetical protein
LLDSIEIRKLQRNRRSNRGFAVGCSWQRLDQCWIDLSRRIDGSEPEHTIHAQREILASEERFEKRANLRIAEFPQRDHGCVLLPVVCLKERLA